MAASSVDQIFLLRRDGTIEEMSAEAYESEALLQDLLTSHPALLSGGQIDPVNPRRWLLIAPEMGIPGARDEGDRWAVDHLFLDQDGIPTFVEVKRSTDTRIRREVVGQMLDYAANAIEYWPVDRIRSQFEARQERAGVDPQDALAECFGGELDVETYWSEVDDNLRLGRVRLVFVADSIPPELERVVEFLNREMRHIEVVAVEVKQYVGADNVTLVPRILGVTAEARQEKRSGRRDDRSFDELLAEASDACRKAYRLLIDWATSQGYGIETQRKSRGIQVDGTTIVRLYPGWDAAYFYLYALNEAGRDADAAHIRSIIRELSGREPGKSEPKLDCAELIEHWATVEGTLLPKLVEATVSASADLAAGEDECYTTISVPTVTSNIVGCSSW